MFESKQKNLKFIFPHHLIVDLVEVYLADLVHNVLVLVDHEPEPTVAVGLLVEHQKDVFNL